jgi:hypothetical protein
MKAKDALSEELEKLWGEICEWYQEGGEDVVKDNLTSRMSGYEDNFEAILEKLELKL